MNETLFISDLHLSEHHAHLNRLFDTFIEDTLAQQQAQKNIDALYILGDFFEVWLGDDIAGSWELSIAKKLKKLAESGISLYFMHGNRDFFVDQSFMKSAHCTLLSDPTVICLYGKVIILKHGDDLCTEDKQYQRFRKIVRIPFIKKLYLSLPAWWRKNITARVQRKSRMRGMRDIYAKVSSPMVEQLLADKSADMLIHGHTHCPQIATVRIGDKERLHIILSDWNERGNRLRMTSNGTVFLDYFHR